MNSSYIWFRNKSTTLSNECYIKYNLVIKIKLWSKIRYGFVFFPSKMLILLTFLLSPNLNIDQLGLRVLTPFFDILFFISIFLYLFKCGQRDFFFMYTYWKWKILKWWCWNLNSKQQIKGWINFVKGTFCQSLWFVFIINEMSWSDEKMLKYSTIIVEQWDEQ